jgi:hypothetical protein
VAQVGGYAALHCRGHARPKAGATIFFAGGVQGAGGAGHYATVVAIAPGGYRVLVVYWRGGSWQRLDYRYAHTGPEVELRFNA